MKSSTITSFIAAISCMMAFTVQTASALTTADEASVTTYLQSVISAEAEQSILAASAVINLSFEGSTLIEAAVAGRGNITLAKMLHKNINWKKFPTIDKSCRNIMVAVSPNGTLNVSLR